VEGRRIGKGREDEGCRGNSFIWALFYMGLGINSRNGNSRKQQVMGIIDLQSPK
jgi:hypothetical protein